jgi:hypothetical protein
MNYILQSLHIYASISNRIRDVSRQPTVVIFKWQIKQVLILYLLMTQNKIFLLGMEKQLVDSWPVILSTDAVGIYKQRWSQKAVDSKLE